MTIRKLDHVFTNHFVKIEENHYEFSLTEMKMVFDDQTTINVPRGTLRQLKSLDKIEA